MSACDIISSSYKCILLFLTSLKVCVCIKQFESLKVIKAICVCINPLKVGSTENNTGNLLPGLIDFLLTGMLVQSQCTQCIIIRFISVV